MSTSMRDLIDGEAELDDEDDESFDEGAGETRKRDRHDAMDDSSEEEEDDEDEEEARRVCPFAPALADLAVLICILCRSEKGSSSTKMRKTKPTT